MRLRLHFLQAPITFSSDSRDEVEATHVEVRLKCIWSICPITMSPIGACSQVFLLYKEWSIYGVPFVSKPAPL